NREEAPTLIVESIQTGESDDEKNIVYVKVPKTAKAKELSHLKKLLLQHPGEKEIVLVFGGNKKNMVKLPFKIDWNARLAKFITGTLEGSIISDVE
ncbi:MAG: hypothetical protein P8Y06_01175, partial [Patescibacteria group bacterium]